MQTYSVESVPAQWPALLIKIGKGEEILLTEKEKPFARLVPASLDSYLDRIRELRGTLKGIDTDVEMEDDTDYIKELEALRGIAPGIDPIVEREKDTRTYLERIRSLRGIAPGIDTDVEGEDDPA